MKPLKRMKSILRWALHRQENEDHLSEELQTYLDFAIAEKQRLGISAEEARRQALAEMRMEEVKERVRGERHGGQMDLFFQDVRLAFRLMGRNKFFAATSILLIATSIGLSCASFAMVDALVLRTLPVTDPERLVLISGGAERRVMATITIIDRLRQDAPELTHLFGWRSIGLPGVVASKSRLLSMYGVTGEYFEALGSTPAMGRFFTANDHDGAVISDRLWRVEYGRDPNILGQRVTVGTVSVPIIGVAASAFVGIDPIADWDLTVPLDVVHEARPTPVADRASYAVEIGARLKEGHTNEELLTHLRAIWPAVLEVTTPANSTAAQWRERRGQVRVDSLSKGINYLIEVQPQIPAAATMTLGLSLLIFCAACLTIALLAVARGVRQQRQIAMMMAIGGTQSRVLRPYWIEALIISLVGGVAGIGIATWWSAVGTQFLPSGERIQWGIQVNSHTAQVAIGMLLVTAGVNGVLVAFLNRGRILSVLQGRETLSSSRIRMRMILLTIQLAVSVVLVEYAILYVQDLANLARVDVGFDTRDLHIYSLTGKSPSRPVGNAYFSELLTRVRSIPGVESVGLTGTAPPLSYLRDNSQPIKTDDGRTTQARTICVFPGLFEAIGLPLQSGRDMSWSDQTAAVVTQNVVDRLYPNENPLGHSVQAARTHSLQIVGVVGNVTYTGQRLGEAPIIFTACSEVAQPWPSSYVVHLMIRSRRGLAPLATDVERAVEQGGLHFVYEMNDQDVVVSNALQQERMLATVSGVFGVLIVVLSGAGLYAFCNYMFALRTRELAIKAGLGASPWHLVRTIVREVFIVLVLGSSLGLAIVLAGRRVIASLVSATPNTAWNLAAGIGIIGAITVAATLVPALRARRLDIARAIRTE